jgi:dipeptidyl-peptidase-4
MNDLRNQRIPTLLVLVTAVFSSSCKSVDATPEALDAAAEAHAAQSLTGKITIEEVAHYPRPGTVIPGALSFSPDGKRVTFLFSDDGSLTRQLYVFDPETNQRSELVQPPGGGVTEENLSHEEKLRRERLRERGLGITRYAWAKEGQNMLVPIGGDIYVKDDLDAELRLVVDTNEKPALDPRLTRDGSMIAYVWDDEVYVVPSAGGTPLQITRGARGTGKTHGLAEYIAQEEMDRYHGHWWSRDGQHVAYTEVDETHIPVYRIEHQGKDQPFHEDHGYPFAGEENAKVKLGVVPASGGATVWMNLTMEGIDVREDGSQDTYLARVHWMPDGSLWTEMENREQTRLDLIRHDPKTGRGTLILRETTDVWINLHGDFEAIDEGQWVDHFLWSSERSGFRHLYLYRDDGTLVKQLTDGDWVVDWVDEVDGEGEKVYFSAGKDSTTERHLYAVPLGDGAVRKITRESGMHGVVLNEEFTRFVDVHSSKDRAPNVVLRNLEDGEQIAEIFTEVDPRVMELGLQPPELVTLKTRDGVTLYGSLYRPAGAPKPWRTIVSVYGGPMVQVADNSWSQTADLRAQYLRSQGFLVFTLDNRGASRRGLAFEGALKHDMGNIEVQDQVDGVNWLVAQGLADPERVGIYGWSYGGYIAAMALARAPDTFQVAVAGAPVTHWDGYDTHYTERYMGTPQSNEAGYQVSSVMHHVSNMRGRLLLVHGLIDENVHFRHTARLINALIRNRKSYEIMMFPDERHMPRREEDRIFMEEQIRDYFQQHL